MRTVRFDFITLLTSIPIVTVKYTDVDYWVFTDAARYVSEGLSPYLRSTYRYTPLLAYLLLPNVTWHPIFGKLLFIASDLIIGLLIRQILYRLPSSDGTDKKTKLTDSQILMYVCVWLFNPIAINVSTRGNAESLVALLVLASMYLLLTNNIFLSALIYGFSVHFKIYPIIWSISVVFYLERAKLRGLLSSKYAQGGIWSLFKELLNRVITKRTLLFAIVSAASFLISTALMYQL